MSSLTEGARGAQSIMNDLLAMARLGGWGRIVLQPQPAVVRSARRSR